MARIERPSYYDAPDDDCPHCGWGPIGCNEEETGCVAVRAGEAGKPVIRGHQAPPRPTVRRVTVSAEMRERSDQLDVG
jgi:hypothetical protein